MDRLFLDANVLFSAAYRERSPLLALWALAGVELVSSAYAVEEARRNLAPGDQRQRLASLLANVGTVSQPPPGVVPGRPGLPEKDRPILEAAVAARATHLITGDRKHFGPLFGSRAAGVLVLPPADYLRDRTPSP